MKHMPHLPRDFHKLQIIKKEAKGNTTTIPSKKHYQRHKEKALCKKEQTLFF